MWIKWHSIFFFFSAFDTQYQGAQIGTSHMITSHIIKLLYSIMNLNTIGILALVDKANKCPSLMCPPNTLVISLSTLHKTKLWNNILSWEWNMNVRVHTPHFQTLYFCEGSTYRMICNHFICFGYSLDLHSRTPTKL